jgi:hypothetical protein
MLVPRQQYSRELKIAAMHEISPEKVSRKWPACPVWFYTGFTFLGSKRRML